MPTTIPRPQDAIGLLKSDHREAEKLFREFEDASDGGDPTEKLRIARKLCTALLVHMEAKECVFYPAVRTAPGAQDMLNEALAEHSGTKLLIAQLGKLAADDPLFDARIRLLGEQMERHAGEEEHKLFAKVKKTGLDLDALGKELEEAKAKIRVRYTG
ncbi:hemerythrin domain-containing protein [Undibacterium sp. TJN25]|uniref:hemerythrin domain-containing protein n=1 Tax=Undibacterium sp. TJN25 TaxID=3413056 RepID=UPI003BF205BF